MNYKYVYEKLYNQINCIVLFHEDLESYPFEFVAWIFV